MIIELAERSLTYNGPLIWQLTFTWRSLRSVVMLIITSLLSYGAAHVDATNKE